MEEGFPLYLGKNPSYSQKNSAIKSPNPPFFATSLNPYLPEIGSMMIAAALFFWTQKKGHHGK